LILIILGLKSSSLFNIIVKLLSVYELNNMTSISTVNFIYSSEQSWGFFLFLQIYSFFHKRAGGQFGNGISMQPILVQQPGCLHESWRPLSFTHKQF